jgi:hypothetical protein
MAVIVPSRGAAETLRATIETRSLATAAAVLIPDLLTRDELYDRLHARLADAHLGDSVTSSARSCSDGRR